jgi:diguanylate cyclase
MPSEESSLLFTIVLWVFHGLAYLALGAACAWWLTRRSLQRSVAPPEAPSAPTELALDSERAEALLSQLHGLTTDVAHNVGEHSSYVAAVGRELNVLADAGQARLVTPAVQAIARLLQANQRLEEQLAHAAQRMQEQAHELELQLSDVLTDPLTQIANRRAFDRELERRIPEFARMRSPVSLVMIDVDHFKKFNDTHGHQAGDEVLRGVARVLKETVREMDLPARFGGEEFAVVLPATELMQAQPIAERIRQSVACEKFMFEGTSLSVAVCVGVSTLQTGDDAAALIKRADIALYTAKKTGRNRGFLHDGTHVWPISASASEPAKTSAPQAATNAAEAKFRGALEKVASCEQGVSLLLVEIDGASLADEAAQSGAFDVLSQTLRQVAGDTDIVMTISDTKQALALSGKNATEAVGVAEVVHARFAQACSASHVLKGEHLLNLGIAEATSAQDAEGLLARAGEALTASRQRGGICFHTCESSEPLQAELQPLSRQ